MKPAVSHNPVRALAAVLAFGACAFLPLGGHAQLYSWKDAQGNVIIKNAPPAWYNENARSRGARVQVLRDGKVIDDTDWSAERRQEGRNTAARQEEKRARAETAAQPSKKDDDDD